jgi:hypothetical protein
VQHDYEVERVILCSDRTVLNCSCGETLILLGREEDWYSEGRAAFKCHQCGKTISFANSANLLDEGPRPTLTGDSDNTDSDEEAMSVEDLIRSLRAAGH